MQSIRWKTVHRFSVRWAIGVLIVAGAPLALSQPETPETDAKALLRLSSSKERNEALTKLVVEKHASLSAPVREQAIRKLIQAQVLPVPAKEKFPVIRIFGENHGKKAYEEVFENAYTDAKNGKHILLSEGVPYAPWAAKKDLSDPNLLTQGIEHAELHDIASLVTVRYNLLRAAADGWNEKKILSALETFVKYQNRRKERAAHFELFKKRDDLYPELRTLVDAFRYDAKAGTYSLVIEKNLKIDLNDLFTLETLLVKDMLKASKSAPDGFRKAWELTIKNPEDGDLTEYINDLYVKTLRDYFFAENILLHGVEASLQQIDRPLFVRVGILHVEMLRRELERLSGGQVKVELIWLPGEGGAEQRKIVAEYAKLEAAREALMLKNYGLKKPAWAK